MMLQYFGMKIYFSGKAQDILLRQSRLTQFNQDFAAKATVLVITTELEIFYQDFAARALLLVPPTKLEIFYQDCNFVVYS